MIIFCVVIYGLVIAALIYSVSGNTDIYFNSKEHMERMQYNKMISAMENANRLAAESNRLMRDEAFKRDFGINNTSNSCSHYRSHHGNSFGNSFGRHNHR